MKNLKADGKNLYIDMDGVLADFNAEPDGVNRFRTEKGFFRRLKPLQENIKALKRLLADGKHNVYILSASPNEEADRDKLAWIWKHRILIGDGKVILCRNGEKKVDYMATADGILFDDYGRNIREWVDGKPNQNKAYKVTADGSLQKGFEMFGLV